MTRRAAELEPIVFESVYPALRAVRHPRLVHAAGPRHPGRPAGPAPPGARRGRRRLRGPPAARARPAPLPDRPARRADPRAPGRRRRGGHRDVPARRRSRALLEHLASFGPRRRPGWRPTAPRSTPRLGTVYRRAQDLRGQRHPARTRRSPAYLELEEQAAQSIFPHYFEKQKTDGVDHQIYVGASLRGGRRLRPALPQEPAAVAAHGRVRHRRPRRPAGRRAAAAAARPRTWCSCSTPRCRSASASTRSASTWTARTTSATRSSRSGSTRR